MKEFKITSNIFKTRFFYNVKIKKKFLFWAYWKSLHKGQVKDIYLARKICQEYMQKNHAGEGCCVVYERKF